MASLIINGQIYLISLFIISLVALIAWSIFKFRHLSNKLYQQYTELNALHDEVRQLLHADVGLGKRLAKIEKEAQIVTSH